MPQIRINRNLKTMGLLVIIFFFALKIMHWQFFSETESNIVQSNSLPLHKKYIVSQAERTGFSINGKRFLLNGKPITLISGAVHYFRFPHQYWEDRLLKMKACGLNTIETYVPWNLHEPLPEKYDFSGDLNIINFLQLAMKLDFLVILRPGPYICSEWEFGGLPSWLLRDNSMKVRTMHPDYIKAVQNYFKVLMLIVKPYQYMHGGPIIAFQLDNEYGAYFQDTEYIPFLKKLYEDNGIEELLFVSDGIKHLQKQTIKNVLKTVNFQYVSNNLVELKKMQPDMPLMVMEFWTGWFDWWGEKHHTLSVQEFGEILNQILSSGSSVNFYMFFGGSNFGFMNGGLNVDGVYQSDITSYDYDALIAENGDLTLKYYKAKSIISQYYPEYVPLQSGLIFAKKVERKAYGNITLVSIIKFFDVLTLVPVETSPYPKAMEMLNVNNKNGQSYGYTLYSAECVVSQSYYLDGLLNVKDRGIVFVNRKVELRIDSELKKKTLQIVSDGLKKKINLDLLVENGGRINWLDLNDQRKGLVGPLKLNDVNIENWTIYSLELTPSFIKDLLQMQKQSMGLQLCNNELDSPTFFITSLQVDSTPVDTYMDMSDWGKGVVFINGKNLGRYWSIGPQKTLFLPAPWLKNGKNSIVIFEEIKCSFVIKFVTEPILG